MIRSHARLGLAAAVLVAFAAPALAQGAGASPQPTAQRPILEVDQVRSPPIPRALAPKLTPLKTLEEVEALLRANAIPFRRARAYIDTRTVSPQLVKILRELPPGEVFIMPERGELTYSRVLAALTPEAAAARLKAPPPPPPPKQSL